MEPINKDGSSRSYAKGGFLPVLRPTSQVAAGGSAVAAAPPRCGSNLIEEWDEDDTFQRPHPLILMHLYDEDE